MNEMPYDDQGEYEIPIKTNGNSGANTTMKSKDCGADENAQIINSRSRKKNVSNSSQRNVRDVSEQLESAYQDLQRNKSISRVEKKEKMIAQ